MTQIYSAFLFLHVTKAPACTSTLVTDLRIAPATGPTGCLPSLILNGAMPPGRGPGNGPRHAPAPRRENVIDNRAPRQTCRSSPLAASSHISPTARMRHVASHPDSKQFPTTVQCAGAGILLLTEERTPRILRSDLEWCRDYPRPTCRQIIRRRHHADRSC
ncbi:Uncharacterised protein [Mycobacteroides abscessus subsp. abscessus]|nr:Uncharacterised protein [Mycobacteroides abscessus subsp. abscessus]